MKLQPSSTADFEIVDPGIYPATIDAVTPKDPNPKFDDAKPQLEIVWLLDDHDDIKIFSWTGQTYGPKSKLRPWLKVLMPDFDPDTDELDTDDLIGKSARIVVTIKEDTQGRERNRVTDVMALEPRGRRSAQPQKAAEPAGVAPPPF